jgi:hypothetical protein
MRAETARTVIAIVVADLIAILGVGVALLVFAARHGWF